MRIKFTFTRDSENIDVDNAVVITLDQEYMAGPATVVFAPLENGRIGNSDALALAAQKAFYEKGFLVDGILCGQMGFRENEDGSVTLGIKYTDSDDLQILNIPASKSIIKAEGSDNGNQYVIKITYICK